mgnify:CR=1 FL=1
MVASKGLSFKITAMDRTKKAFAMLGRSLKGVTKAMFSFKTAIVGLVGVAGIGLLVKQSLSAIDNIGKMSKTLGIATKDLQAMQLASQIGGVELQTFAKASRQVSKGVFDFLVKGTGEALDGFQALGIAEKDLLPIQNDTMAIMGLIADKLNEMPDGTMKTAIAFKLLGGRAVELLPALEGGSEAMENFKKEAELFGNNLDGKTVKGVENFNDSLTRLKFMFNGLRDNIVAKLAPIMDKLANKTMTTLLEKFEQFGGVEQIAINVGERIVDFVAIAIRSVAKLVKAIQELKGKFDIFSQTMSFKPVQEQIENANKKLIEHNEKVAKLSEAYEKLRSEGKDIRASFVLSMLTSTLDKIEDLKVDIEFLDGFEVDLTKSMQLEDLARSVENLKGLFHETTPEIEETNDALEEVAKPLTLWEHLQILLVGTEKKLKTINNVLDSFKKAFGDAIADAVLGTQKLGDALRVIVLQMIKQFISSIIQLGLEIFILDRIREKFTKMKDEMKKLNQNTERQIGLQLILAAIGGGSGGGGSPIPFFHQGGTAHANQPAIVGEKGAELIIPNRTSSVIPNKSLSGLGQTTNVNFTIHAVDTRGFKALLRNERGTIVNMINQAVTDKGKAVLI